jgi:hypothetical protein
MTEYEMKLRQMDWWYQYSDDGRVWRQGNEDYKILEQLQKSVDPDRILWNKYCPWGKE